ncbi:MAG: hypothetical protein HYS07_11450 [Chlamydiae bacterium]|nr:hypothetical protein [Chlamydiota bacterium]MBI3278102.1 hypothetical protein [Chlamydiota bacterium]
MPQHPLPKICSGMQGHPTIRSDVGGKTEKERGKREEGRGGHAILHPESDRDK